MCGIAGAFAYHPEAPPPDPLEIGRMTRAMAARGPDGEGLWIAPDSRLVLGHRRLSIIDLSEAGSQPMVSIDGRLAVTFNGEIFNYRDLRREMEGRGWRFRSNSDTEVLLALWSVFGPDMVHHLRGMFAFALWDAVQQTLFLARDPFGIKPLYVANDGKTIRFASQVKALIEGRAITTEPDLAGWAGFWQLGHVPDPHTTFRNIKALPAGHQAIIRRDGQMVTRTWFDLTSELQSAQEAASSLQTSNRLDRLAAALENSLEAHQVSDVPVGLFLSAGLDSSMLLALSHRLTNVHLRAITLGFQEFQGRIEDEIPLAKITAHRLGVEHQVQSISHQDFEENLSQAMAAMDQPSIDGLNTYFVAQAAKKSGIKVALSGLGGDELLGGYPSFNQVPNATRWLRSIAAIPGLGKSIRRTMAPIIPSHLSPKIAGIFEFGGTLEGAYLLRRGLFMPWELAGLLGSKDAKEALEELDLLQRFQHTVRGLRQPHAAMMALESTWYMGGQLLRDADWAGMAHGVEIRVPFVDVELFRALAPIQAGPDPLRKSDLAALGQRLLPREVLDRPKTGFTTPIREWAQASLGSRRDDRGLRGWARVVANPRRHSIQAVRGSKKILVLATDAYGSIGGIARFNRDFIEATCEHPEVGEVVLIPRVMPHLPEPTPPKLTLAFESSLSLPAYLFSFVRRLRNTRDVSLIVCGHINLLPLAKLAQWFTHAPQILITHGIEAWAPPVGRRLSTLLTRKAEHVLAVSSYTWTRLRQWSALPASKGEVFPNTFSRGVYAPGPKPEWLLDRYRLQGRIILLTVGRMASLERYKGFDEVLELLPKLRQEFPNLTYLAVGDGNDRPRLEAKARSLGVSDAVVFTGYVPEGEKADHYRLADAFVMPSRGEGFGIVFLEALASGIPVVGSRLDGGSDALQQGRLGTLVDPDDPEDTLRGIRKALASPRGVAPDGLDDFAFPAFTQRTHKVLQARWRGTRS